MGVMGKSSRESSSRRCDLPMLTQWLRLFSLLTQFCRAEVRADFKLGKLSLPIAWQSLSLEELDLFAAVFVPPLHDRESGSLASFCDQGVVKLNAILNSGADVFPLIGAGIASNRTCAEWGCILVALLSSSYWKKEHLHPSKIVTKSTCMNTSALDVTNKSTNTSPTPLSSVTSAATNTPIVVKHDVGVSAVTGTPDSCVWDCSEPMVQSSVAQVSVSCASAEPRQVECVVDSVLPVIVEQPCESVQLSKPDPVKCAWCGRTGHLDSGCWRKLGRCLICGGDHHLTACSKFVPRARPVPRCSMCSGKHLGRNCCRGRTSPLFCHWCGKSNHLEEHCWHKQGCCLLCGSSGHELLACSKFVPRPTHVFPP